MFPCCLVPKSPGTTEDGSLLYSPIRALPRMDHMTGKQTPWHPELTAEDGNTLWLFSPADRLRIGSPLRSEVDNLLIHFL